MANPAPAIRLDRLLDNIEQLGAINKGGDGSCRRVALTDADREGRDLVVSWMRQADLRIHIDQIGNIIGIRNGELDGPPVMTGSHIDTVATGGRFDGAYGVLSGIEAIRALNEAGCTTRRPIAVTAFTNEEGVRYQPDMMGSLVYAGGLGLEEALSAKGEDASNLGEELSRIGYAGSMRCGEIRPRAYVELHIEQGPILDRDGLSLGVVTDLQGISWQSITIRGTANHAGTTPMSGRSDAGYCAGRIAVFARDLARQMGGAQLATVGSIQLVPNLINVIAREARLTVDLRNTDDAILAAAKEELGVALQELAESEGVSIEVRQVAQSPAVKFDAGMVAAIEAACRELGHTSILRMTSGAGHDAQMMARICPAGMIFVPSIGGVSHSPREATAPHHLELGANVLLRVLSRLSDDWIMRRDEGDSDKGEGQSLRSRGSGHANT